MKHDKIVLLAKSKLNSIKVLICEVLVNSNLLAMIIQIVLKQFYDTEEDIKNKISGRI